jgi:hypothetical protein
LGRIAAFLEMGQGRLGGGSSGKHEAAKQQSEEEWASSHEVLFPVILSAAKDLPANNCSSYLKEWVVRIAQDDKQVNG